MDHPSPILTLKEFQKEYKCSHGQTYREIAAGRLKVRKMGRATRVTRPDADAWAASLPTMGGE
jgi:hypothetical protein